MFHLIVNETVFIAKTCSSGLSVDLNPPHISPNDDVVDYAAVVDLDDFEIMEESPSARVYLAKIDSNNSGNNVVHVDNDNGLTLYKVDDDADNVFDGDKQLDPHTATGSERKLNQNCCPPVRFSAFVIYMLLQLVLIYQIQLHVLSQAQRTSTGKRQSKVGLRR